MSTPGPRTYLDNAATSFPKPPAVIAAMVNYAQTLGTSARGAYAETLESARLVNVCRQRIASLVGCPSPQHVVFTLNTTDAMNLAIHGVIGHALATRPGPIHIITSELDHNSALRPFNALVESYPHRIQQSRVAFDPATGKLDPAAFARAVRPETVLVATLQASNVTGVIQPIAEIAEAIKSRPGCKPLFLLDAAQSLGHVESDMAAMGVDLLAFPGHKGLLGPTGTGGLCIMPGVEHAMHTVRQGGTGFRSELEAMPEALPERFEPGSHNTIGIIGLSEGVAYLSDRGHRSLRHHEIELGGLLLDGLMSMGHLGINVLGPADIHQRVGVFSWTCEHIAPAMFGTALERDFGVLSRSGLHCAPAVYKIYGAVTDGASAGATRLSIGPFTTREEILLALEAVGSIASGGRTSALITTAVAEHSLAK